MSKKKQKKFATDADSIIFLLQRQADQQDEIIDLLHVLVDQIKPKDVGAVLRETNFNVAKLSDPERDQQAWEVRRRQLDTSDMPRPVLGSWQRQPKERAREEVEDYHGIATTEPYSVPVRIHR